MQNSPHTHTHTVSCLSHACTPIEAPKACIHLVSVVTAHTAHWTLSFRLTLQHISTMHYSNRDKMSANCSDLCCKASKHSEKEVLYDSATLLYTVAARSPTCTEYIQNIQSAFACVRACVCVCAHSRWGQPGAQHSPLPRTAALAWLQCL